MTVPRTLSKKVAIMAGGGVLALAVAAWGVSVHYRAPAKPVLADPEKLREQLDKPGLTEEQRHELEHSMREAFQAQMDSRVDEYFQAPENEKLAILDKQIDEFQKRRKEMEERRNREEERRRQEGQNGPTSRPNRDWRRDSTPEQRQERSESRSPDKMAQRMAYWQALQARMAARGIQTPRGPGRGGPGGGGPGGGGRPGGGWGRGRGG